MSDQLYILEGKKFRVEPDTIEWGKWMQQGENNPYFRHVARTYFHINDHYYCDISTVFLGIDHNFGMSGGPILFESMIFGGDFEEHMERYPTWEQAEIGHNLLYAKVDTLIRQRHDVQTMRLIPLQEGVKNIFYFLKIPGHIEFKREDLRLLRED